MTLRKSVGLGTLPRTVLGRPLSSKHRGTRSWHVSAQLALLDAQAIRDHHGAMRKRASVPLIVFPGHVLLPCSKFHMVDRARLRQHVGKELHPTKTCNYPRVANLHAPD